MTTQHDERAELIERIRNAMADVRRKSYPLADLIPMMQQAADMLAADAQAGGEAVAQERERRAWMCAIAFDHEVEGDASGTKVYPSLDALKKAHPMWEDCGVTEVVLREVLAPPATHGSEKETP